MARSGLSLYVKRLKLPSEELRQPFALRKIDDSDNVQGKVTHKTTLRVMRRCAHSTWRTSASTKCYSALDWLKKHIPEVDGAKCSIKKFTGEERIDYLLMYVYRSGSELGWVTWACLTRVSDLARSSACHRWASWKDLRLARPCTQ